MAARSTLPQVSRIKVGTVPGPAETYPLTGISVIYEREGIEYVGRAKNANLPYILA
jgi:hypothetical protein